MRRWMNPLGPLRRKTRTGVPADHFPKAKHLFAAGRMVALVADGETDPDPLEDWYFPDEAHRAAFASSTEWVKDTVVLDEDVRDSLIEAAEAAGGRRGEPFDNGVSASVMTGPVAPLHAKFTGVHSHQHSHKGVPHTHAHFHNGSTSHNHSHAQAVITEAETLLAIAAQQETSKGEETEGGEPGEVGVPSPTTAGSPLSRLSEQERRRIDGANEITDPDALAALVASAFDARGGLDAWTKLRTDKGLTAAANADGTITPAEWHAYLCAEGIRTDDGRELMLGACRYPDLPVTLRLLVEDEGGHWGAVTCGRIDLMEARDVSDLRMHYSEGLFGSDPNGQLAELMVEEQTQRFVSIDPRDATAEWIEVRVEVGRSGEYSDEDEGLFDCWMRITDCVIGAATIVAMPALPQAVITLRSVALPEAPIANASADPSLEQLLPTQQQDDPPAIAASGASPSPRREWFNDPGFHVGDARLVRQADERSFACPPTVGDRDPETGLRPFYSHVAWWNCEHTAMPGQRIKPPRSKADYAYYLTGPGVLCNDGSKVEGVGVITMGCGHAPMTRQNGTLTVPLSAQEAVAHYDGGYGAVQVVACRAGQDDFGPWVAGYVLPHVTDEQLDEFMRLSLSGDWREIAGNLEMVAVLAVPVPGFPVRRALAASGAPELVASDFRAGLKDEHVYALVAAGMVKRVTPEERIAHLEHTVAVLDARITAMAVADRRRQAGL